MLEAGMAFAMLLFVLMLFAVPVALVLGLIFLLTAGIGTAARYDATKNDPRHSKPW